MSAGAEPTTYRRIVTEESGQRRPVLAVALEYDPNIQLGRSRASDWPRCQCGSAVCPDRELLEAQQ